MPDKRGGRSGRAGRGRDSRLKSARGRTVSSARWLKRQIRDPYVAEAKRSGYRSRAAFKLIEIDDRFHLLRRGAAVLDLGAAPGGWTQVAAERVAPGRVVAVDEAEMAPVAGATVLRLDVSEADAPARIREALGGGVDVVLSDMAPAATGHAATDHLRIVALAEAAFAVAREALAPGGAFVAKVYQGGAEGDLLAALKQSFRAVRHVKPPASRPESREMYVVATGFRGGSEG